jgi:hypothetical protein
MTMLADAFKLPYGRDVLARLLKHTARGVARHALEFDNLAGLHDNLQVPSRYLVTALSNSVTVLGREQVPERGPVLITCNHPGVIDAMVVFASLPRTDVKVIARPGHLLDALPNVHRHIIVLRDNASTGIAVLRDALRHLSEGGLVVTFPRGAIEPDPQLHLEAATASLVEWSLSTELLVKHLPGLTVVPAAVGGVVSIRARASWLSRRHRTEADRDWMAATLQFMLPTYRDARPTLAFGSPLDRTDPFGHVQTATRALYRTLHP